MYYVLLDSTGNLIESHDSEDAARAALAEIVAAEPGAASHVAMIAYDASGAPLGPATMVEAPRLTLEAERGEQASQPIYGAVTGCRVVVGDLQVSLPREPDNEAGPVPVLT